MTTPNDIVAMLAEATRDKTAEDPIYLKLGDGNISGTEFVWMPYSETWVWITEDSGECGSCLRLTLIFSEENGDDTGLNSMNGLITAIGLWVSKHDSIEIEEIPEDAEVRLLWSPFEALDTWKRSKTVCGKTLSRLLAECPSDAFPHGVRYSDDGDTVLINGVPFDLDAEYRVFDNVRRRDPESVNTIDSDWSVECV